MELVTSLISKSRIDLEFGGSKIETENVVGARQT